MYLFLLFIPFWKEFSIPLLGYWSYLFKNILIVDLGFTTHLNLPESTFEYNVPFYVQGKNLTKEFFHFLIPILCAIFWYTFFFYRCYKFYVILLLFLDSQLSFKVFAEYFVRVHSYSWSNLAMTRAACSVHVRDYWSPFDN